jgi:hypothetical protein
MKLSALCQEQKEENGLLLYCHHLRDSRNQPFLNGDSSHQFSKPLKQN